jgi:hypothetical protein
MYFMNDFIIIIIIIIIIITKKSLKPETISQMNAVQDQILNTTEGDEMKHNETGHPRRTHGRYEKYHVSVPDATRKTTISENQDLRRDSTGTGIKNGVWGLKIVASCCR